MRILVLRPGAIGDTLLAFPVIEALRARYAGAHITVVGNMAVLPLALYCGVADEIADYEEARWSYLFLEPARGLSRLAPLLGQVDMVIAWIRDIDGIVERNLKAAGVRQYVVAAGRPNDTTHVIQYLAATVGVTVNTPPNYASHFSTSRSIFPRMVAVHPGSGGAQKCWPAEHFANLIERLVSKGQSILLLAGPADRDRMHTILRLLPNSPLLRLFIDAPLSVVATELCSCLGFIGNDAGITHLSAMLGVPTLALFGPTDPRIWQPYGRSVSIIHALNLEHLRVDSVLAQFCAFVALR